MENIVKNPQARWYTELMQKFQSVIQALGLDEDSASEIKVFVLQIARDQYMAGNRSGIRWARTQSSSHPVAVTA